ncbi:MAG TPA: phosphotransferase [Nocardioides sp.]|uniref:phosphotransferase n=1 Tax=Nocardioides sp. TaxID=35761 RepID=UPI002E2F4B70|nr:phosphotransferase [Nocardioides sp.]HEX5087424.1 phosphotransferase [Nocardioides sp.]
MSVRRVQDALEAVLGPDAHVEHRFNHTGADKMSFAVRVGERRLWAKVAAGADDEESLETWAELAGLLSERHAAPELLDVLTVDGRTALLFPYLDARPATRSTLHERYAEATELLAGLHADRELAERLGEPTTSAACFRAVWLDRFEGDLDVVEGYLTKDLHAYLEDQVGQLAALVDTLDDEVHVAVHGDPWHENFLIGPERVWLLDWEDLAVGDPVVDHAILRHDACSDPRHWPDEPAYAVARRALMLDEVVDVAADWVENTDPLVRRQKEAAYLAGLEAYRSAF